MRILAAIIIFLFIYISFASAADLNYPYSRLKLIFPPAEDPFPGMGTNYSTLSKGMKTATWNPASLAKLKLTEASLSMANASGTLNYQRSFNIEESSNDLNLNGGSPAGRYGVFFRYPDNIGPGINTKEVEVLGSAIYSTEIKGMNFSTALKANDWLTVGFATTNPFGAEMDISGDFPVTAKALTDFYGQTLDQMQIASNGKLKYTFTDGGTTTTYESIAPLWSGFLSQEATVPFISLSELRNNLSFQSPYIGTIAANYNKLYVGLNMIPISATSNINNNVRSVVDADTSNVFIYTPNFNPSSETELVTWINDPDKYGTQSGYQRKQILLPAGEMVAETRYRGFYSASTARFDLGAMYDLTDWFTVGLVMENATGSSLNFKGTGTSAYINYRDINTAEAEKMADLFTPGGTSSVDLFTDRWITTYEVEDTKLYLEPEKNYVLPKKIKMGFTLKRPFLITVDYEQNQTPIIIQTEENSLPKEILISNINLLRIGTESKFLIFPLWLQSGFTFLLKPTVTGLSADEQKSFDDIFQFGLVPLSFDLGANTNAWGTIIGSSIGLNGESIFKVMQLDTVNADLSKLVHYTIYGIRDPWEVTYTACFDPGSTATAYGNKTVPAGQEKSFELADVKMMQTLGVTYRF